MSITEFFTFDNISEIERNYKILLLFVLIPCAVWWNNLIFKILGSIHRFLMS